MNTLEPLRDFLVLYDRPVGWLVIEETLRPWAQSTEAMPLVASDALDAQGYLAAFNAATGHNLTAITVISRAAYEVSPDLFSGTQRDELLTINLNSTVEASLLRNIGEGVMASLAESMEAFEFGKLQHHTPDHGDHMGDELMDVMTNFVCSVFLRHESEDAWRKLVMLQQQAIIIGVLNGTLVVMTA